MKRRLFNLAATASLVVCVATAALWVRSYHSLDQIIHRYDAGTGVQFWSVYSTYGSVGWGRVWAGYEGPSAAKRWRSRPRGARGFEWESGPPHRVPTRRGFLWETSGWRPMPSYVERRKALVAPHWFLVLLFAATPSARVFMGWTRRSPRRDGHCPACGYDLRATPERCPECGTEIVKGLSR
jgi:hypothetical protein